CIQGTELLNAAGSDVAGLPVRVVHTADPNAPVFATGVDELAVAHVEAHVGKAPLVGVLEVDDVTRHQLFRGNLDTEDHLIFHRPRVGAVAQHLIQDVPGKAGAIETGRGGATPDIGNTHVLHGCVDNGAAAGKCRDGNGFTTGTAGSTQVCPVNPARESRELDLIPVITTG